MTPEFLRYVKKVQQTLANYIELPKTPCATCTKFLKCNDKEFLTFNMPCSAYTNTKNQKITFSDKQKFLIDILRNDEQNNEKPETFIKLITDNCKKLNLPKHITQSILPKGKEHQQEKVQRTPSATKQELKTSFLHNLKKYKTIKQAAEITGISESLPYNWQRHDKQFQQKFQDTYSNIHAHEKKQILKEYQSGVMLNESAKKLKIDPNEIKGWITTDIRFSNEYNKIKASHKQLLLEQLQIHQNFAAAIDALGFNHKLCTSYRNNDRKFREQCENIIKISQQKFLQLYKQTHNITEAAKNANIEPKKLDYWLKHYPTFAQQFNTIKTTNR